MAKAPLVFDSLPQHYINSVQSCINVLFELSGSLLAEIETNWGLDSTCKAFEKIRDQIQALTSRVEKDDGLKKKLRNDLSTHLSSLSSRVASQLLGPCRKLDDRTKPDNREKSLHAISASCKEIRRALCDSFGLSVAQLPQDEDDDGQFAVICTDLFEYTRRVKSLVTAGESVDAAVGSNIILDLVSRVNVIIKTQLTSANQALPANERAMLIVVEGDGATLRTRSVAAAILFGISLHHQADLMAPANGKITPFQHRVGIGFGWIRYKTHTSRSVSQTFHYETAGLPFIMSSRMEGAAKPGEIVVEQKAWEQLQTEALTEEWPAILALFEFDPALEAKHQEFYPAYVCKAENVSKILEGLWKSPSVPEMSLPEERGL